MVCNVETKYRSKSNVVFNFLNDKYDTEFVDLAKDRGIIGINGHRSVGGIRVSLFNSIDDNMFQYFMDFFKNFITERK
jgi:phosphoserine aminotransferase